MKKRILTLMIAVLALLCTPIPAFAAKKTVYVISSITVKNTSGSTVDTLKYSYNKKGLITKRVWSQPGGTMKETFAYNKQNLIKTRTIYADGKKISKFTYTYNGTTPVSCKQYYYETKESADIVYTSDETGRLTTIEDHYTNSVMNISYNSKNQIVTLDEPGFRKIKYKYDKKGNVTKQYWDGSLFRKYKNTYVKKTSRLKKVTVSYPSGKKICTDNIKYKKMKVNKTYVPAVKKQQVEWSMDPLFEMFPM